MYQSQPAQCGYLPFQKEVAYFFVSQAIDPAIYERLISQGFRRSGHIFYQHQCPDCQACFPIRVDVRRFTPSKSQRRVLKKNRDVSIRRSPNAFEAQDFHLYQTYCQQRHPDSSATTRESYCDFLIDSPLPSEIMRYYINDQVVGLGWIDLLPHALSSVYFSFDPAYSARSLGTFSILQQIELCRVLGKDWLYLGFWIKECQKMSYKNRFKPCHLLVNGAWCEVC